MANREELPLSQYRQVSELRRQYQCEYKMELSLKYGEEPSVWSKQGERLHNLAENDAEISSEDHSFLFLSLLIITILAGAFWILL
ncbi:MAG: hypothetical protein ACFFEF_01800 [Candidatus Thorarchaeota archaeon]